MITGAHVILFSTDAEADRAFFRDVLEFPFVDSGGGWLIFALPPGELATHPADASGHEIYLMCDDVAELVERLTGLGIVCTEPEVERWGSITRVTLPGGGTLGIYQPTHPSPVQQGSAG
jgi:catechol 2,3-dioxygenase-like lactoylglutathione lyase family enzyme